MPRLGPTYGHALTGYNFDGGQFDWFYALFTPLADVVYAYGAQPDDQSGKPGADHTGRAPDQPGPRRYRPGSRCLIHDPPQLGLVRYRRQCACSTRPTPRTRVTVVRARIQTSNPCAASRDERLRAALSRRQGPS